MGPTRVNRKLSFESGEEQIKGYGKVTQNTEIFSTKYGNNILEVGSPDYSHIDILLGSNKYTNDVNLQYMSVGWHWGQSKVVWLYID